MTGRFADTTRNITLGKATANDSEFAFQTKKAAFRQYVEQLWGWDEVEQRNLHAERFRSQEFYVVHSGEESVGVVAFVRQNDCYKLNQLFILPEKQSRGIGSECIKLIAHEANRCGLSVRLQVLKVNNRAFKFYKRLGFSVTGETDTHIQMELSSG